MSPLSCRIWSAVLSRERIKDKLWKLREMLKEARRQGLTLATYDLTVDRNYVGRVERAEVNVSFDSMVRIAAALEMPELWEDIAPLLP